MAGMKMASVLLNVSLAASLLMTVSSAPVDSDSPSSSSSSSSYPEVTYPKVFHKKFYNHCVTHEKAGCLDMCEEASQTNCHKRAQRLCHCRDRCIFDYTANCALDACDEYEHTICTPL